jgi:hypothetical protein
MRIRLAGVLAAVLVSLVVASSAAAFDCLRVSASYQGLVKSTSSGGNWLLFDWTNPDIIKADLTMFATAPVTDAQALCMTTAYQNAAAQIPGLPLYFALGFGVAGGNTNGPGVLDHNNPNNAGQLGNLKGIDHLDASPIGGVIFSSAGPCGITLQGS